MTVLLVALGGALGAAGRYLVDVEVSRVWGGWLPLGTLLVNLLGSLAFGLVAGLTADSGATAAVLGTGLCGAFTTWSGLAVQTVQLLAERPRVAAAYVALTLVGGLAMASLGLALTR